MRGRWRLFRQDAARTDGPGLWAFLAAYVGALALATLSTRALDAIVFWPANGVMVAALLVLPARCLGAGMDGHLAKPISVASLASTVAETLHAETVSARRGAEAA